MCTNDEERTRHIHSLVATTNHAINSLLKPAILSISQHQLTAHGLLHDGSDYPCWFVKRKHNCANFCRFCVQIKIFEPTWEMPHLRSKCCGHMTNKMAAPTRHRQIEVELHIFFLMCMNFTFTFQDRYGL